MAAEAQPLEPRELVLQRSTAALRRSGAKGCRARNERRSALPFLGNNRSGEGSPSARPDAIRLRTSPLGAHLSAAQPRLTPRFAQEGFSSPSRSQGWHQATERPTFPLPPGLKSAPGQRTVAAFSRRPWAGAPRAAERCGRRADGRAADVLRHLRGRRAPAPPAGSSVLAPASPAALAYLLSACPWARTAGRLPPGLCEAEAGALLGRRRLDNTWREAPRFWAGVLQRDENGDPHERHFHM